MQLLLLAQRVDLAQQAGIEHFVEPMRYTLMYERSGWYQRDAARLAIQSFR
jgi:hypothetical protein